MTQIGTDLVFIPKFARIVQEEGEVFLSRVFSQSELRTSNDITHLAGVFAAKEAVVKALSLPAGEWLAIQVISRTDGKPLVTVNTSHAKGYHIEISISHEHEYAIAMCIAYQM